MLFRLTTFAAAFATLPVMALAQDDAPFTFYDDEDRLEVAEGACGEGAADFFNETAMVLDDTWTMEFGPFYGTDMFEEGIAPVEEVPVMIDAEDGVLVLGGATFPSEVPLDAWQGDEIPFAAPEGGEGLRSEGFSRAVGCAFGDLPRLTARGAYMRGETAVPFLLVVALVNPRVMLGMAETTVGTEDVARLVRLTR